MDVKAFQEKLRQISALAKEQNQEITMEQIRNFFPEGELEESQLEKIQAYLRLQDIQTGDSSGKKEEKAEVQAVPLTAEEEIYLREYLGNLGGTETVSSDELEPLYSKMAVKDPAAYQRLTEIFLPKVAAAAKEYHTRDIFLGDLIQEGNIALLTALNQWNPQGDPGIWLLEEAKKGMAREIQEKERQDYEDEVLVEKVRKLEAAVRELTEEDDEKKFTIGELSILLDMEEDEIRDVLRLTGDDQ